uniref:Uncharacterized protein n=1 Tax=Oryza nivara TaxID=4536 RepID=A0A0E0FKW7_ORYNI
MVSEVINYGGKMIYGQFKLLNSVPRQISYTSLMQQIIHSPRVTYQPNTTSIPTYIIYLKTKEQIINE